MLIVLTSLSYLWGAFPHGLLIAKARGVDIRTVGSGNIGATNVYRSVGKGAGALAFLLDAVKGFVPAWGFPLLAERWAAPELSFAAMGLLFGMAAIVGHNWPIYLRFKGGKGVATSAGVLLGVAPAAAGIGLLVWVAATFTTGYVSLGSITAAAAVPVAGWVLYAADGCFLPGALTVLGLLILWRHRANIQRLRAGTENRFGKRGKHPPERRP